MEYWNLPVYTTAPPARREPGVFYCIAILLRPFFHKRFGTDGAGCVQHARDCPDGPTVLRLAVAVGAEGVPQEDGDHHLETDWRVTPSCSASSSCDQPAFLRSAINLSAKIIRIPPQICLRFRRGAFYMRPSTAACHTGGYGICPSRSLEDFLLPLYPRP